MRLPPTVYRLLLPALCACSGCALWATPHKPDALSNDPPPAAPAGQSSAQPAIPPDVAAGVAGQNAAANGSQQNAAKPGSVNNAKTSTPDPRLVDDILAELAALGPMQPEAQQRLIEDLRKTPPEYWPMLVQTFRASMAYRRRNAERTSGDASEARAETEPENVSRLSPARTQTTPPVDAGATTPSASPSASPDMRPAATTVAADDPVKPGVPVSTPPVDTGAWRQHLDAAISELDRQTKQSPQDNQALANQVYLRLLDLTAGRRDDALRPIAGLSATQQDYWSKQLFALATYLDSERVSDPGRRAAEASIHLTRAVASLAEESPLVVRNLAFCTDVQSYGVLKRVEPAEFKSGQHLLLYAEIENFKSEETAQGFHTSLEARYQILDAQGRRVAQDDLPLTEEHCQNRRRDFFLHYFLTLPKTIYDGSYKLELTIEDRLAKKIGQSTIDFVVKEKK